MFINFQTHSKFSNSARQFSPNFSRNDQHNHSSKGRETPQKNLEFSNNSRHNKVRWHGIPRQDESAASPNFTKKKIPGTPTVNSGVADGYLLFIPPGENQSNRPISERRRRQCTNPPCRLTNCDTIERASDRAKIHLRPPQPRGKISRAPPFAYPECTRSVDGRNERREGKIQIEADVASNHRFRSDLETAREGWKKKGGRNTTYRFGDLIM
jgi:hypothetical protein